MRETITAMITMCMLAFSVCAQSSKNTGKKSMETEINVTVNGVTKTASLVENAVTKALLELLAKGSVAVKTDDYSGFEKVGTFGSRLPEDNSRIEKVPGDIVLYQGNSISFFYATNAWNCTRLGKLNMAGDREIRDFAANRMQKRRHRTLSARLAEFLKFSPSS